VLFQHDNYGLSAPVVFRSKAQCAGNGRTLVKHCNAVAEHHRSALWVSLSGPTDFVVPLGKGVARAGPASEASALGLACEARLAVNPDKLTERAIIMLKEHSQ
jgi:hypothetical protein